MITDPIITILGNMANDPTMRYTTAGVPVVQFSIAANPRTQNRVTGEWENGEPVFLTVNAWRDLGENVAMSLHRGDPVLVVGKLRQRSWQDEKTGVNRRMDEITADTVAVPLDRRIVRMTKVTREHQAEPVTDDAQSGPQEPASQPDGQPDAPAPDGSQAAPETPADNPPANTGRRHKAAHAASKTG